MKWYLLARLNLSALLNFKQLFICNNLFIINRQLCLRNIVWYCTVSQPCLVVTADHPGEVGRHCGQTDSWPCCHQGARTELWTDQDICHYSQRCVLLSVSLITSSIISNQGIQAQTKPSENVPVRSERPQNCLVVS